MTDKPVSGDYTGDGKADIAFFRPSTGFWFILRSEDNSFFSFPFGTLGDIVKKVRAEKLTRTALMKWGENIFSLVETPLLLHVSGIIFTYWMSKLEQRFVA